VVPSVPSPHPRGKTSRTIMSSPSASGSSNFIDAAIHRANSAWNVADIESSSHFTAMKNSRPDEYTILTPSVALNPKESLAVIGLHTGIRKFWKRHSRNFTLVWTGMAPESRRNLLLTVGPDMAKTNHQRGCEGQLLLLPELVADELSLSDNKLISLIQDVVDIDLNLTYWNDSQMIRTLIKEQKVFPDDSQALTIAMLHGGDHVGQTRTISQAHFKSVMSTFAILIQNGHALEGPVWSLVINRRHSLLMTLALLMDEMKTNVLVLGEDDRPDIMARTFKCSFPSCEMSHTNNTGKRVPMKQCSRCKIAYYCGRECQRKDWKNHKKKCGKTIT